MVTFWWQLFRNSKCTLKDDKLDIMKSVYVYIRLVTLDIVYNEDEKVLLHLADLTRPYLYTKYKSWSRCSSTFVFPFEFWSIGLIIWEVRALGFRLSVLCFRVWGCQVEKFTLLVSFFCFCFGVWGWPKEKFVLSAAVVRFVLWSLELVRGDVHTVSCCLPFYVLELTRGDARTFNCCFSFWVLKFGVGQKKSSYFQLMSFFLCVYLDLPFLSVSQFHYHQKLTLQLVDIQDLVSYDLRVHCQLKQ